MTKPPAPLIKTIWSTIGEHDNEAVIVTDSKGNPEPDPALRDTENVPLTEDIQEYFAREVLPHVPDAWIDHDKTKSATKSPSPATSTATSRRGHWRRSKRTSAFLWVRSRPCSPRSARELALLPRIQRERR